MIQNLQALEILNFVNHWKFNYSIYPLMIYIIKTRPQVKLKSIKMWETQPRKQSSPPLPLLTVKVMIQLLFNLIRAWCGLHAIILIQSQFVGLRVPSVCDTTTTFNPHPSHFTPSTPSALLAILNLRYTGLFIYTLPF